MDSRLLPSSSCSTHVADFFTRNQTHPILSLIVFNLLDQLGREEECRHADRSADWIWSDRTRTKRDLNSSGRVGEPKVQVPEVRAFSLREVPSHEWMGRRKRRNRPGTVGCSCICWHSDALMSRPGISWSRTTQRTEVQMVNTYGCMGRLGCFRCLIVVL